MLVTNEDIRSTYVTRTNVINIKTIEQNAENGDERAKKIPET